MFLPKTNHLLMSTIIFFTLLCSFNKPIHPTQEDQPSISYGIDETGSLYMLSPEGKKLLTVTIDNGNLQIINAITQSPLDEELHAKCLTYLEKIPQAELNQITPKDQQKIITTYRMQQRLKNVKAKKNNNTDERLSSPLLDQPEINTDQQALDSTAGCAICHQPFDENNPQQQASMFSCSHLFHGVCAEEHLLYGRCKLCPLCRAFPLNESPLHIFISALQNQDPNTALAMLESKDFDVNARSEFNGDTPLIIACKLNYNDIATSLMAHPIINISLANFQGKTALHVAIEQNNDYLVGKFLAIYSEKGIALPHDITLQNFFYDAIIKNKTSIACAIIDSGAIDLNARYWDGRWTPLEFAINHYNDVVTKYLIEHPKIDLMQPDLHGRTPLELVSLLDRKDILLLLLKKQKDKQPEIALKIFFNMFYDKEDQAQAIAMIDNNDFDVNIKEPPSYGLIEKEGGVFERYLANDCQTPLMAAIDQGEDSIAEHLINNPNIDLNMTDVKGSTALHWAIYRNNKKIFDKILEKPNLNLNLENKHGNTPLDSAVMWNRENKAYFVEKLFAAYAKAGIPLPQSFNLLKFFLEALQHHDNDLAFVISKHPAFDVNAQDQENGETPLIMAINYGNNALAEYLIEHPHINLNTKDKQGNTALVATIGWRNKELVEKLLKKPTINIYTPNTIGETPFMLVCNEDNDGIDDEIAQELIAHEQFIINPDATQETPPLTIAMYAGRRAIIDRLVKCGAKNTVAIDLLDALHNNNQAAIHAILNAPAFQALDLSCAALCELLLTSAKNAPTVIYSILKHQKFPINKLIDNKATILMAALTAEADEISATFNMTPLTFIKALLDNPNIDLTVQNEQGKTALDYAQDLGNQEIIDLINDKLIEKKRNKLL